jgi:hypothetical protein
MRGLSKGQNFYRGTVRLLSGSAGWQHSTAWGLLHVEHFPELSFEERHHRAPFCGFSSHQLNAALAREALSCKKVSRPRFVFDEHDARLCRFHERSDLLR